MGSYHYTTLNKNSRVISLSRLLKQISPTYKGLLINQEMNRELKAVFSMLKFIRAPLNPKPVISSPIHSFVYWAGDQGFQ